MNPKVDWFFDKPTRWQEAYQELRTIALTFDLEEELKWGCPCYTLNNNNVFLIHGFKHYCALLFMKGAIMKDPEHLLIQQTENVQSARQLRFTSIAEIMNKRSVIASYIRNAVDVEKSGMKVAAKKTTDFTIPAAFQAALTEMSELKSAFYRLTPGRQRGYLLHFSSAKQSKTVNERIERCIPKILDGKGLDD